MTLILKEGAGQKDIKSLEVKLARRMQRRKSGKGFDSGKYKGTVKLKEDPMKIQKRMRDEWERDFG